MDPQLEYPTVKFQCSGISVLGTRCPDLGLFEADGDGFQLATPPDAAKVALIRPCASVSQSPSGIFDDKK
jgi:hypothetical protein